MMLIANPYENAVTESFLKYLSMRKSIYVSMGLLKK